MAAASGPGKSFSFPLLKRLTPSARLLWKQRQEVVGAGREREAETQSLPLPQDANAMLTPPQSTPGAGDNGLD